MIEKLKMNNVSSISVESLKKLEIMLIICNVFIITISVLGASEDSDFMIEIYPTIKSCIYIMFLIKYYIVIVQFRALGGSNTKHYQNMQNAHSSVALEKI